MPGQHYPRCRGCAFFAANQAAEFVLGKLTQSLKIAPGDFPDGRFISWYSMGFGQVFEQSRCIVHAVIPRSGLEILAIIG